MILSQGTFLLPFLLASVILVRVSPSSPDTFCVIPVNGTVVVSMSFSVSSVKRCSGILYTIVYHTVFLTQFCTFLMDLMKCSRLV